MFLSIVIPTLNSEKTLGLCLDAIRKQSFPHDKYEIVVADAGSTDRTLEIAEEYSVDIIASNPLKTGEAGKTAGIKASKGDIVALIDSDNILPDSTWIERMLAPFSDTEIIASEPIEYTWKKTDPALTRYFALLGMNDPICLFTGNYDRMCAITGKWTDLHIDTEDKGDYLKLNLTANALPTIGANGFLFRRALLDGVKWEPYLFDIDILYDRILKAGSVSVAKVKTGIVHLYCSKLGDFSRKQKRRIRDFLYFAQEKERIYPWDSQKKAGIALFCFSTITFMPLLWQMLKGFCRKPDFAWLFHVPVCWITLFVYGIGALAKMLGGKQAPVDRSSWQK
ncbi:MAG: glycosyltransferase family 2 protein [Kiritimatiellae bacterium]|nr:glycosyltransferase family 2 protein [Kiritimatiellia bacterium]